MPTLSHARIRCLTLSAGLWLATGALAGDNGIEFSGSGFLTLGAGKMLGGTRGPVTDRDCPCFTSDYAQGGVYDGRKSLQWGPDSKLGLQGTARISPDLAFTAQAVARGARDGEVNLEWLYASYRLDEHFTLQVGRKRLPMFYYSDTQDVGFALPWTHLPPQLYGWEAVNYNGMNLTYQGQAGEWTVTGNLLYGAERYKDSGYYTIYEGRRNRTDVKWDAILGGDLTFSRDWFEGRLVYIQSHTRARSRTGSWFDAQTGGVTPYDSPDSDFSSPARQRIYGAALNIDHANFLLRGEAIFIDRPGADYKDNSKILGLGYRLGRWTPMLTWSHYRGLANLAAGGDPDGQERHRNLAWTLRYDLTTSSALKVQYDQQKELGGPNWQPNDPVYPRPRYGDAKLLTVTYDLVF